MIGKSLYRAKIRDGRIIVESNVILKKGRKLYHFNEKGTKNCFISDVGVVIFLTEKEALNFLAEKIRKNIEFGEDYLEKSFNYLKEVNKMIG